MSDTKNKFYLTTPIYYVNARPHIGHAYTTIAADVIARCHRLLGPPVGEDGLPDTFFLTGTDEHGQKIQRSAEAAGIPPQQFTDEVSASFQNLWKRMGITNDKFIRTTDEAHKKGVQKLFTQLQKNGFIELRSYTGQYCISDETFVDVPIGAPCPECGRITETVTEENYFFKLSQFQSQLIDLIESNTLAIQPDSRKNEVLSFLRGSIVGINSPTPPIIKHSNAGSIYVEGALKDLSISRTSVKWGIPVPGDEKHVIYVWLDALSNYMTAIGYGSDNPEEQAKFKKYWPADLHLVGKEIIRFHCVYWPAFLLALNPALADKAPNDLPFADHLNWAKDWLPKAITAHGWLLFEESKMSKSRGNIVRTETILDAFGTLCPPSSNAASTPSPDTVILTPQPTSTVILSAAKDPRISSEAPPTPSETTKPGAPRPAFGTWEEAPPNSPEKHEQDLFASDVLRYFLLREIPFGQDGSFSFDALVQRYNSDLANGYGNLVSRTLAMIQKFFDGVIPSSPVAIENTDHKTLLSGYGPDKSQTHEDGLIIHLPSEAVALSSAFGNDLLLLRFARAFEALWLFVGLLDAEITAQAPWKIVVGFSEDEMIQHRSRVLYTAAEGIRIITALVYPILPYATSKVWAQLGLGDIEQAAKNGELKNLQWGGLKPGTKLGPLSPIFPRAPKELIQLMNDMEASNAQKAESLKSVKSSKSVVENAGLPHINNNSDASIHPPTEFRESPISSESATASLNPIAETTHPITAHHPDPEAALATPQIAIDDFIKIDLRVAQIVVAERIPKADKLLRLEVDLGYERRQILSGIAQWYTPEELIGRRIVVIANLAPRKMRGLESHGMLLAASHGEDGKPVLATFAEDIALGSRLK